MVPKYNVKYVWTNSGKTLYKRELIPTHELSTNGTCVALRTHWSRMPEKIARALRKLAAHNQDGPRSKLHK